MTLQAQMEALRTALRKELAAATNSKETEAIKVRYLGKKGPVQELLFALKEASAEERPALGKQLNALKEEVDALCQQTYASFFAHEEQLALKREALDITLPGRAEWESRKHIVLQTLDHILAIFKGMGFSVQYGPDVETDYYNFEALNFPPDHPARDLQDTFYIDPQTLLRTHTSNTQVRVMEAYQPPLRIVCPGKCYRKEDISARSHICFHQVELLYVDRGVTFADLMATLREFLAKLFGRTHIETRFRPSYFPFVEPGMEVDVRCIRCHGQGCAICKHTGWLEVLGSGMVHPEVLKFGGIDPERYSGYAAGIGVERLVMLQHAIPDIRLFSDNDLRLLEQFS